MKAAFFKAVFFDAGGTLLHPFPSVGEIYARESAKYGCHAKAEDLQEWFKEEWIKRDGLTHLASHTEEKIEKAWWRDLVSDVFKRAAPFSDFDAFFEELYELFGHPDLWRLYPSTLHVLQTLKQTGVCMGIISNWDSRLFQLCDGLGLSEHFDFILASAKFGAAKPSQRIFEEALRLSNVNPEEALHVGDSLNDDVFGAGRVGIRSILINRHPERQNQDLKDHQHISVIHDLSELL